MKATILHIDGTNAEVRAALEMFAAGTFQSAPGQTNKPGAGTFQSTSEQHHPTGVGAFQPTSEEKHTLLRGGAFQPPSKPITHRKCDRILSRAPKSLGELPSFFEALDDQQLDTAWVACIIDCVTRDEGRVIISQLAAACNAIRSRYRAAEINREPGAQVSPAESSVSSHAADPDQPKKQADHRLWTDLLADLLLAIPNVGDEIVMREFAPDKREQSTLRNHMVAKCDDDRVKWISGRPGGSPPAMLRRVKP